MAESNLNKVDTVFITSLLCDAYDFINTGRVHEAKELIEHSLVMLPDNGSKAQLQAITTWQLGLPKRGFNPK